jgi:hypothetical protein
MNEGALHARRGSEVRAWNLQIKDSPFFGLYLDSSVGEVWDSRIEACGRGMGSDRGSYLEVHNTLIENSGNGASAAGGYLLIQNSTIRGSSSTGIFARMGGILDVLSSVVESNGESGIWAMEGAVVTAQNTAIRGNGRNGVMVLDSAGRFVDDTRIEGNTGSGIRALRSVLNIQDATIQSNTEHGVSAESSRVDMNGPTITGNQGNGVDVNVLSSVVFHNNAIITNNPWLGVSCGSPPDVTVISGEVGTMTGNGGTTNCPNWLHH